MTKILLADERALQGQPQSLARSADAHVRRTLCSEAGLAEAGVRVPPPARFMAGRRLALDPEQLLNQAHLVEGAHHVVRQ